MAASTQPIFASTPKTWAGTAPATLDTSLTAPANITTLVTAGANGTKIEQITINYVASTTASCVINIFNYDGSTYHLFDSFIMNSGTVATNNMPNPTFANNGIRYYKNWVIQTGWSVRFSVTVATGQSAFKVTAQGGDF